MIRASSVARAVSLVGLAAAGLLGGHALGYALAVPDAYHRTTLVEQTGHGYLPSATWVAVVGALAALAAGVAAGCLRRGREREGDLRWAASRLCAVQVVAFVLLEVLERLATGAALGTFSPRLMVAGIAAQIVVALVLALAFVGLRRVGAVLGADLDFRFSTSGSDALPRPRPRPAGWLGSSLRRERAPPARLAAQ